MTKKIQSDVTIMQNVDTAPSSVIVTKGVGISTSLMALPALQECEVIKVALKDIHIDDPNCDYRVEPLDGSLNLSLVLHGQQVPVVLYGDKPFEVINGHRRIRTLREIGVSSVLAIIRDDIESVEQAHALAFIDDNERLALDAVDRAHLISKLEGLGKSDVFIKEMLGISDTTLKEARRVLKMNDYLRDQLKAGRINNRHAQALHKYGEKLGLDYAVWVSKAETGMSSREVEKELRLLAKASRPTQPSILKKNKDGEIVGISLKVTKVTDTDEALKALEEVKAVRNVSSKMRHAFLEFSVATCLFPPVSPVG